MTNQARSDDVRDRATLVAVARAMAFWLFGLACVMGLSGRAVEAGPLVIKLGTLAPEDSVWYKSMREADQKLREVSDGQLQLRIYPGGVSGNESAIIRKMRINQLQAGSISAVGLIDIDRNALALQTPLVIRSFDELRYVREKMDQMLDHKIEANGFKVLAWGEIGWTYFFTNKAVSTPDELKQVKMFAWEGDPPATEAFRKVGLHPVTVASTDVLPALQTGMIEGFPASALSALSFQWFGKAPYMVDLRWAPMIGATVISLQAWNKIPAELQPKVLEIFADVIKDLNAKVLELDTDAIERMKEYGLTVVTPTDMAAWETFGEELRDAMTGTVMPRDAVDEVLKLHKEYKERVSTRVPSDTGTK